MNYIVYALPRSRSYWLSRYLTYGDWQCGHEEIRHCRSLGDVTAWFSQCHTGTVETAAAPYWRLLTHLKTVVLRRSPEAIADSMTKLGYTIDRPRLLKALQRTECKLRQIECRVPNVMSITFDQLREEGYCQRVFEFCLPYRHDPVWYRNLSNLNLQVNVSHMMRYWNAYQSQLLALNDIAKYDMLAMQTSGKRKYTEI